MIGRHVARPAGEPEPSRNWTGQQPKPTNWSTPALTCCFAGVLYVDMVWRTVPVLRACLSSAVGESRRRAALLSRKDCRMLTDDAAWDRSLARLRELGQLSATASRRAASARAAIVSTGASDSRARDQCMAVHSALQARSKVCDVAYVRAAGLLLRRAGAKRRPPKRLPQPRPVSPSAPSWWVEAIHSSGAVWRRIPQAGPEYDLGLPLGHPGVAAVTRQAELLGASRLAKNIRGSSALYEVTESGRAQDGTWTPAALRVRPGMENEARRLHTERHKMWERARAYGDATLALLTEWRTNCAL